MAEDTKATPNPADKRGDADAIDPHGKLDERKHKENQQRLKVGPDHKTPEMKKGGRGTYP